MDVRSQTLRLALIAKGKVRGLEILEVATGDRKNWDPDMAGSGRLECACHCSLGPTSVNHCQRVTDGTRRSDEILGSHSRGCGAMIKHSTLCRSMSSAITPPKL